MTSFTTMVSPFIQLQLIIKPSIIFSISQDGTTPLSHAAYKGNTEACNILLEHGADVNLAQHEDKVTIPYLVML